MVSVEFFFGFIENLEISESYLILLLFRELRKSKTILHNLLATLRTNINRPDKIFKNQIIYFKSIIIIKKKRTHTNHIGTDYLDVPTL